MNILRLPSVIGKVVLSRVTIYRRVKAREFPAPIKLGRMIGWVESEVDDWIAKQVEQQRRAA